MTIPDDRSHATHRRRSLAIAALAAGIVALAWNVPGLSFALYPLRLLVTFVHESGHVLAAVATGGDAGRLAVRPDGSGFALTAGGLRAVILPAGYVGAALFGAALFLIAVRAHRVRRVSAGLALVLGLLTLRYAGFPSMALVVGLGFAALLGALAYRAGEDLNRLVLVGLALVVGLNALFDVTMLVGQGDAGLAGVRNDAAAFSAEVVPFLPGAVWAVCWSGLALALLAGAAWLALVRPGRPR